MKEYVTRVEQYASTIPLPIGDTHTGTPDILGFIEETKNKEGIVSSCLKLPLRMLKIKAPIKTTISEVCLDIWQTLKELKFIGIEREAYLIYRPSYKSYELEIKATIKQAHYWQEGRRDISVNPTIITNYYSDFAVYDDAKNAFHFKSGLIVGGNYANN